LEDTINYAAARKIINAAMTERPYKLIERAAEVVATALLDSIDKLLKVEVILKKPNAPMSAVFDYVAVKITKKR